MSDSIGFKDKFRNKFNVGKIPRKPLREEVTALRARALKLPQTDEKVKGVVGQLNTARDHIFGPAKTNKERENSITLTEDILKKVRTELAKLEENKPEAITYEVKCKKASKEDQKRAKDLLGMLTPLQKEVEALFTPDKKKPLPMVVMPPDLGRLDLLGQIETARVHISQSIVDEKQGRELSKEIGAATAKIAEARKFIEEARASIQTYDKQLEAGANLLAKVSKELTTLAKDKTNGKVPTAADTPLALRLAELQAAAHPEMSMINPGGLQAASAKAQKEMDAANQDAKAYARSCCSGSQQKNLIEQTLKEFDAALKDPMDQLYIQAFTMGALDHSMIAGEIGIVRSRISGQKVAEVVDIPALTGPIIKNIKAAIDRLAKEAEALRKRVADAHKVLNDTLTAIADTKGKKFFAADWIAVDALLSTINGLMPAPGALLDQATFDKLASAEPLITKLKSAADALDPTKSKPEEDKFDLAKAAIEKILKKGDTPAATLKKYDPKKWAELEEGYAKVEKMVGVSKFADTVKAITAFQTDAGKFDDSVKKGKELAPVIAKALKAVETYKEMYKTAHILYAVDNNLEQVLPYPNTQAMAIEAVEAELKKTPPDKAKLEKLTTDLATAFKGIDKPETLTPEVLKSNKTEIDKAKTEKDGAKANREELQGRYYKLEMQFSEAKAMVKEAKGDPNAVKSLERLMKQAESEIGGVTADKKTMTKPAATMDRIQQRIDLMISHPEGEVDRHRSELPGLYNEFRQTRADCEGQLHGVMGLIGQYLSEQGDDTKVEALLDRVTEYAVRFTRNGDDFAGSIEVLVDKERPEGERRKAREHIVAGIAELSRGIIGHPISALLADSPLPGAKGVPRRLLGTLDRLNFTVLTSVEA